MIIQNNTAYIAAGVDGFKVFDITNINNSIELGKYQLSDGNGFAHQLQIQGNYAYVAYDVSGLRIIDIANPSNISLAGVYMMGENNPPITNVVLGSNFNKALTTNAKKGESAWIDVSQPTSIFTVYLDTAGYSYSVSVIGNIAYVADNIVGLQLINVSDPSNPILLSNFNTPGYSYDV